MLWSLVASASHHMRVVTAAGLKLLLCSYIAPLDLTRVPSLATTCAPPPAPVLADVGTAAPLEHQTLAPHRSSAAAIRADVPLDLHLCAASGNPISVPYAI